MQITVREIFRYVSSIPPIDLIDLSLKSLYQNASQRCLKSNINTYMTFSTTSFKLCSGLSTAGRVVGSGREAALIDESFPLEMI